ncbi:MAG: hypothetical protein Q4C61_06565 [Lachnospiraceae bacterium]|nr:hypothetical protein [Lachnospiraceae bacterium]
MREFVQGTNAQYDMLKKSLEDSLCHIYPRCRLPDCCSKATARIGFEQEAGGTYALFIDKGITCSDSRAPLLFRDWLAAGTVRFLEFTDMKVFLQSLKCLY